MNNKKNIITSLLLQGVVIIQGLILPRLNLAAFGSEVNGLVSSISQFLSFISLLEGGLGTVVLAELYKPIEERDEERVKKVLAECQSFFTKLALLFVVYTVILAIAFPFIKHTSFSFGYICTLVFIISLTTLTQYLFSITYKLFLQADQKIYIVHLVSTGFHLVNMTVTVIILKLYPRVHLVKLVAGLLFMIQPIVFRRFVDKRFHTPIRIKKRDVMILPERWSGFGQNLAHFVNMNTDVAVLTFIVGYKEVSVYSIYMIVINALRSLITNVANSYHSALGKYYARGDKTELREKFYQFEALMSLGSVAVYNTCLILINQFIRIYTKETVDANYYQPVFAIIMVFATLVYCVRLPYQMLVTAAGKFRETNTGAFVEAGLNLVVSVCLVFRFGLIGVAVGTLLAITYRYIYFLIYLRKNILETPLTHYIPIWMVSIAISALSAFVYFETAVPVSDFFDFFLKGAGVFAAELALAGVGYALLYAIRRIRGKVQS